MQLEWINKEYSSLEPLLQHFFLDDYLEDKRRDGTKTISFISEREREREREVVWFR
jgi:hypothetical protein